jgi:Domain of unknown function (DUF2017)
MAVIDSSEDGVRLRLEEIEVELVLSLTRQLVGFVGYADDDEIDPLAAMVGIDPDAVPSTDAALLRLLPDAFRDDDEAAAEFRRFTERDLRLAKVGHAMRVQGMLQEGASASGPSVTVVLSGEDLSAWLGFLNDARLVLGARLELTEDNQEDFVDLPDDDPRSQLYGLYGWLTYVQESVVSDLMDRRP